MTERTVNQFNLYFGIRPVPVTGGKGFADAAYREIESRHHFVIFI